MDRSGAAKVIMRNMARRAGCFPAKPSPPKAAAVDSVKRPVPTWECGGSFGIIRVKAWTKGEARCILKTKIGVPHDERLPTGIEIELWEEFPF